MTAGQVAALPDAAFAADESGRVLAFNTAAEMLLGWDEAAAKLMTCPALLEGSTPEGRICVANCARLRRIRGQLHVAASYQDAMNAVKAGGAHPDLRVRAIDGQVMDVTVTEMAIDLEGTPALLHLLRPIPEPERDELTGCMGRREFQITFEAEQSHRRRHGEMLSLALIDLDSLKKINDNYGHHAGDEAIVAVVESLRGRQEDILGRWGGDEFVLLLDAVPVEAAGRLWRALIELRNQPVASGFTVGWSAGVAEVRPSDTLADALQRADVALYRAKHAGAGIVIAGDQ